MFSKLKNILKKENESIPTEENPLVNEENDHNSRYNAADEESYLNNYKLVDEFMNEKEIPLFSNIEIETEKDVYTISICREDKPNEN